MRKFTLGAIGALAFLFTVYSEASWNYIINGDMTINQRGYTTTNFRNTTQYPADRFRYLHNLATGQAEVARVYSDTETADLPSFWSLKATSTATESPAAASYALAPYYQVEGTDLLKIKNKTVVLSFYAKTNYAGEFSVAITNMDADGLTDRSFVKNYTLPDAKWTKINIIIPLKTGTSTGSRWSYSEGTTGIKISWVVSCGSNYQQGTDNQWVSTEELCTSATASRNLFGASGRYLQITGVSLYEGTKILPFEKRPNTLELLLAKRYYHNELTNGWTNWSTYVGSTYSSGTRASTRINFPVTMARAPVITFDTATNYLVVTTTNYTASAVEATGVDQNSFAMKLTITGAASPNVCLILNSLTSTVSFYKANAELL